VLNDAFAGLRLSFALPRNRPAALAYVARFAEEAKASGVVQRAIDDAAVGDDVKAAAPE
jgi:polar amino acid transport system substrate-binding protein